MVFAPALSSSRASVDVVAPVVITSSMMRRWQPAIRSGCLTLNSPSTLSKRSTQSCLATLECAAHGHLRLYP